MTVTEVAQSYLGNCLEDPTLNAQVELARVSDACLDVELAQDDCAKSRIHVKSKPDLEIGIIKERGWSLREGDVFKTERDRLLVIHLESQQLIALSLSDVDSESALSLIHLGHTLGNHHCPIFVTKDKIYIQLADNRELIESTIQNFQIPGLKISYETRSTTEHLPFQKHTHHPHLPHHPYPPHSPTP